MSVLIDEARAALASGHLAHLVTLNPDGSPQVTIVWVGLEGDELVSGHLGRRQKLANVRRDPRVVLSLVTGVATPVVLTSTWSSMARGGSPRAARPSCCSAWPRSTSDRE